MTSKVRAEQTKNRESEADFQSSRRSFLRTMGAITAGGVSAAAFPGMALAKNHSEGQPDFQHLCNMPEERFWRKVRRQFVLDRDLIYMQTGTEGSIPKHVLKNMYRYYRDLATSPYTTVVDFSEDKSGWFDGIQEKNRAKTAEFLGANTDEIVLTMNTTDGTHLAFYGLDFDAGDEIIMNLHDHDALRSPILILAERNGVLVNDLELPSPPSSQQEIVDLYEAAITPATKAIAFCHINYTTGLRMPVKALCAMASKHGVISIVDGAHAPGMIDIDLHDLGCDFYACSGHKWLNGPPGTGIFYMRGGADNPNNLWPERTEVWPMSYYIYGDYGYSLPQAIQLRGQNNTPAYKAMTDCMDFVNNIGGIQKVESRVMALNNYLKERIIETWGPQSLWTPMDPEMSTAMASFHPFQDPALIYDRAAYSELTKKLRDRNLHIRYTYFKNAHGDSSMRILRYSTHFYVNFDQIDEAIEITKEAVDEMEQAV